MPTHSIDFDSDSVSTDGKMIICHHLSHCLTQLATTHRWVTHRDSARRVLVGVVDAVEVAGTTSAYSQQALLSLKRNRKPCGFTMVDHENIDGDDQELIL